jgi:hypothetical protein
MSRDCLEDRSRLGGGSGTWLLRRADVRGQVGHAGVRSRPRLPARARSFPSSLVGEHASVDDVGQAPLECAHGHHRGHPAGLARVVIDPAGVWLRSWTTAMMCSARLIRRLPARESRWRSWLPEEASSGAVPFQDANLSRSAKRWMSPASASSRAALDGPMPCSSSRPTASAAHRPRSRRRAPGGARCACRFHCSPRPPTAGRGTSGPRRASAHSPPCPCRTCQHRGPLVHHRWWLSAYAGPCR